LRSWDLLKELFLIFFLIKTLRPSKNVKKLLPRSEVRYKVGRVCVQSRTCHGWVRNKCSNVVPI
jgi:hypothetical protein